MSYLAVFRKKTSVACVAESLIPTDKAYLVEFHDKENSNDPELCWKTCAALYPNTSLGSIRSLVYVEKSQNITTKLITRKLRTLEVHS